MTAYLVKFIFYTAGVIGFLLIAYVVAKNCLNGNMPFAKKTGNLEIEETLAISPRKTLHIIKAFDEKFLIASDANSTTLLAKLNNNGEIEKSAEYIDTAENIEEKFSSYMETKPAYENNTVQSASKRNSVIQSMLEKLNNN